MNQETSQPRRVAVIGGGIAGLAAAHRVMELAPSAQVAVFEASDRLGGVLGTVHQDGFLIERSADSFITSVPWGIELCRRIGFADQLISTQEEKRGAEVVAHGKLERVPAGFLLMSPTRLWPILRSPILSWGGKLRLAGERFVAARRESGDESVASFARRRLGREAYERLVQPLVGGIYTADPEKLSLQATLPRFLEMEREHGSLRRGARMKQVEVEGDSGELAGDTEASDRGARYSMFVAPREGMTSFVTALATRLPKECVRLKADVRQVMRDKNCWRVRTAGDAPGGEEFDAVIVATPSAAAARLLGPLDAALSDELRAIDYAGCAIVALGYDRAQIAGGLNSFGFVVPAIEGRRILSASFSSVKFPGRAPAGKELIRVFLGGALQPEIGALSDAEVRQIAEEELRDLLGVQGAPCVAMVFHWHAAMPQYHLGHAERLRRIEERVAGQAGLALAGNAFLGVGIPQCIRSGEAAAERVMRDGKEEVGFRI